MITNNSFQQAGRGSEPKPSSLTLSERLDALHDEIKTRNRQAAEIRFRVFGDAEGQCGPPALNQAGPPPTPPAAASLEAIELEMGELRGQLSSIIERA
jgi:hypothetical protein